MKTQDEIVQKVSHPLEPLTASEIKKAVSIIRKEKNLGSEVRFEQAGLNEPSKDLVLNFKEGDPIDRQSFMVILNRKTNQTFEAVVSITNEKVISWSEVPAGQQASFVLDEYTELEETVKKSPEFQKACAKRGVTDMDLVMVDPWSAGHFDIEEDEGRRVGRALCFVRRFEGDNAYGYPLTGLIPVVDLNTNEIIRIEDSGVRPLPEIDSNYNPDINKDIKVRTDLKPLEITMPEGPSFEIDGHFVKWQKWQFRIGYTAREGLVLHTLGYEDKGEVRPIIYRAALSEMIVPYGDPTPPHNWQNAFDAGEYGLGQLANSLTLGCDCKGEIRYFDATMCDGEGDVVTVKNAICMHEEDYGIAWKHTDWRTNEAEVRRSRRLVISFFTTVANYDYGFYWYLYTDGTIEHEVKLTGMLNQSALYEGEESRYGTEVAPGIHAPHHQHFFNYRIDTQVDGVKNSIQEVNTVASEPGRDNPNNNAFYPTYTIFETETEASRNMNLQTVRRWRIINENRKNFTGKPVAYILEPGENCSPFASDEASVLKRAPFLKKHVHVTQYDPNEMYAPGNYPNQKKGGGPDELTRYVAKDRNIRNEDIVLWYTAGLHHITRPEDWPVMPTAYLNFKLRPQGFFDGNPALDLPRPTPEEQRKN